MMRRVVVVWTLLVMAAVASAQDPLAAATDAYRQGDFPKAATLFAKAAEAEAAPAARAEIRVKLAWTYYAMKSRSKAEEALAGALAEHMVEDHRRHPAMDVAGRPLICGAEVKVGGHAAVAGPDQDHRWGNRIAEPDHRVAPGHFAAVRAEPDTERALELLGPELGGGGVDFGLHRGDGLGGDLCPDGGVDEFAYGLRQRFVDGSHARHFVGAQLLQCVLEHP